MTATLVAILGTGASIAAVGGLLRALALFQQDRAKGALEESAQIIAQSRAMREDAIGEYARVRERMVVVRDWGRRGWDRVVALGGQAEQEP